MESTPINTPVSAVGGYNFRFAASRKASERDVPRTSFGSLGDLHEDLDHDDLLFPDDNPTTAADLDAEIPLFPTASPFAHMAGPSSPSEPIAIQATSSRPSSHSPRTQQSSMTPHFQQPRIDLRPDQSSMSHRNGESAFRARQESVGMLGTTPHGARSIPAREGFLRRESNALSGSLMNGMSWGGISMGSYIRDE